MQELFSINTLFFLNDFFNFILGTEISETSKQSPKVKISKIVNFPIKQSPRNKQLPVHSSSTGV